MVHMTRPRCRDRPRKNYFDFTERTMLTAQRRFLRGPCVGAAPEVPPDRLYGRCPGDVRDVVHPVVLAQREQSLGLRGQRPDGGLGLGLAQEDPVVVAARADLSALGGVSGPHRGRLQWARR